MKLLNKVKISLLISTGIILILSIKAFAVTGTITEITVNMRKEPSTDSKKIMYVTQDDKVEVLEKVGDWYKIKADGITGYVFGEYVKVDDSKIEQKEEDEATIEQEETQTNNEEEKQEEVTNTNLIIKSKTQVRIIPNISSSVIYTASKNISVNIIEQMNDWTYVSVGSVFGWVRTDKIVEENAVLPDKKESENKKETTTSNAETTEKEDTYTKTTKQEIKTAYIKYDTVNLREKASTSAKVLAKLKLNEKVIVLDENNKWSKVEVDGKTGYISTELLSDEKQEEKKEISTDTNTTSRNGETTSREETTTKKENKNTTENEKTVTNEIEEITVKENVTSSKKEEVSSSKVTGEDIVAYAKKYLGYDYVYGGASPSKGFDCSGFTYYVYKHFGYTLSRSSTAQANNGTKVDKKELQPGDLVIYKNTSLTRIGHVGIYIGDNKMIHASEPGVGVTITDIDSKAHKYPQRYVTARRIIK